jgi:predicted P-loop ATPase
MSPSELIPFPGTPGAEQHANAETKRKHRLYAWADDLLRQLGLVDRVSRANSVEELRKITFDADAVEVGLAIRDALHPTSGQKAEIFAGLREGSLKRVLNNRFNELKKEREAQLLRGQGVAGRRQSAHSWTDDLKLDDKGCVRPLLSNLILFLRHHQKWKGVLAFNEFNNQVVIVKRPPWGEEPPEAPWTDHHESLTRVWLQREDINAAQGDVGRAVQAAARANPFHPVRDYFEALTWDGTPRLDTWLVTYLHAGDTPYARAVGPRFLTSSVARIYKPGAKVDHSLVLEGLQGKQKSEALRTLAIKDEWFTDRLSHIGGKDAIMETAGVLLVEIAEMDALKRASSSASKGFLTRRHDRFRPPYGKHTINLPRQCVFAGTINPPVGGYLTDPTGARRFWPVLCHGMIDREGIERDRDQLWAEAVVRFKARTKWWLETPELEALATAEQKARFKVDVWKEPVEQWLGKRKDVSISEVLQHALGIAKRDQTQAAQNRVVRILTDPDLGFTKYRPRKGRKRQNRYWREKC